MKSLLTLAYISISIIYCKAITVRDDESIYEDSSKKYSYSHLVRPEIGQRQEDFYKYLRRADIRYEEDNNQEPDYSQSQSEENTENYPVIPKNSRQQITRRIASAKKPQVEQYLKEVTPTTKTTFYQKPRNYLRLDSESQNREIKYMEDLQRDALKQPIQYITQPNLQQKPQIQYIIPEPKSEQSQQNDQQSHTATLRAYQNALLAHQRVLETEDQGATSRSSIYVSHTIPKKTRKIVKPTTAVQEVDHYPQLQYQQNEQQEAAPIYQAKERYLNTNAGFQISTEIPSHQQERIFKYQPVPTQEALYQEKKLVQQYPQQLTRQQQQHLLLLKQEKLSRADKQTQRIEDSADAVYQNAEARLEYIPTQTEKYAYIQYQQPRYIKKGPRYLPLDETERKYKVVNIPQKQEALKYPDAAVTLETGKQTQSKDLELEPRFRYQQEQPRTEQSVQYKTEVVNEPEIEYANIESNIKHGFLASPELLSHQNTNFKYYRNLQRPALTYSRYQ